MTKIKEITRQNFEYRAWEDAQEDEGRKARAVFIERNTHITFEDLQPLTLAELKELKASIKYSFDAFKSVWLLLEECIKQKRLEEYPEFNKAKYYPVLNKIDFLTKEEIIALDDYLYTLDGRYTVMLHMVASIMHYGNSIYEKVFKFLHAEGAIQAYIEVECKMCGKSPFSIDFDSLAVLEDKTLEDYEKVEKMGLEGYCDECDSGLENITDYGFTYQYSSISYHMREQPCRDFLRL